MLLLTRRVGESIVIDGGITITVDRLRGRGVRLGIEAPPGTRILRSELLERVQRQQGNDTRKQPPAA